MRHSIYYDGKVHVLSERCATCIFEPGNRMHLQPGRVKAMLDETRASDAGSIPCHKTLDLEHQAICRGFWETQPHGAVLQLAERFGIIEEVALPND